MEMAESEVFWTYEGRFRILVEQVIDDEVVDWHLVERWDISALRDQLGDGEDAIRALAKGEVASGGITAHTEAVKAWVGKAVNWTGERTDTGYEFIVAK